MITATPISTARIDAAERSVPLLNSLASSIYRRPAPGRSPRAAKLPCEEPRFLHEQDMPGFLASNPGLIFFSVQRGLVERALLQETLPVGRVPHLLQQLDVVLHLIRSHSARHEDAPQHQVLDVQTGLLAGRDVVP